VLLAGREPLSIVRLNVLVIYAFKLCLPWQDGRVNIRLASTPNLMIYGHISHSNWINRRICFPLIHKIPGSKKFKSVADSQISGTQA
jgi:hypothetical protein